MKDNFKKTLQFKSIPELLKVFPTEQKCIKYFEKLRWRGIITSPFDPNSKVYKCKNNRYKCKNTGKYFNVRTGTVFESSKIDLRNWLYVLYNFVNHKKGISSYQIVRDVGITQKSAWFMLHRLRLGFDCSIFKTMLENEVEIDETFLGGSNLNRHGNKKAPKTQGRNGKDKIPFWGGKQKDGNLIVRMVSDTKKSTLEPIVRKYIKEGSNVHTDEGLAYNDLGKCLIINELITERSSMLTAKLLLIV